MLVPKNKTIYIGSRRFIEGDVLPPFVMLDMPVMTKKQAEEKEKKQEEKQERKRYKPRTKRL